MCTPNGRSDASFWPLSPEARISGGARRPWPGILCCGNAVFDTLAYPAPEAAFGRTAWVESIIETIGGNGANTSYAIAVAGVPARLISAVGKDREGAYILETLSRVGVDIEPLISTEMPTPKTVVLVNAVGERAFLHRPGASRSAFSDGLALTPEMAAGCTRFHLANLFALPGLRPHGADLLRQARTLRLHTSADTGWDARGEWIQAFGPCLREIELLFVNEDEARQLTRESGAREAAHALRKHGPECVVVKLGAAGCLIVTAAGETVVPGFRVNAIDTTGAGDCFTGMFLAALQRGCAWEDAARFANAAGALNVQQLGATRGVRSWEETAEWMRAPMP